MLPLALTVTFELGMHTQFTDEENGVCLSVQKGHLTGVVKQEWDLNRLRVSSTVSHKGTMTLDHALGLKSIYQLCDPGQVIETHLPWQWE